MKIAIKALFLQLYWFLAVKYGSTFGEIIFFVAILLSLTNFKLYQPKVRFSYYIVILMGFILYGTIETYLSNIFELIEYKNFPVWIISLYAVFICYYGDVLNYIASKKVIIQSFIGGGAAVASFYSGAKMSELHILSNYYFLYIFISWCIFFPLSISVYYKKSHAKNN